MKNIPIAILITFASLSALNLVSTLPFAETQTVQTLGLATQATFTLSGLDASGAPESLAIAEVALTSVTVADLNVAGTITKLASAPAKSGVNSVSLTAAFTGLAPGSYKPWARAIDAAANASAWVAGPAFVFDCVRPAPPTNVQVSVTVTVGAGNQ